MPRKKRTRNGAAPQSPSESRPSTPSTASRSREERKPLAIAAAVLLVTIGVLGYALLAKQSVKWWSASAAPAVAHVGSKTCAACHADAYEAWRSSDHALAMQHAEARNVTANFENSKFTYAGVHVDIFHP
jgi:hypothetical protein